VSILAPGSRRAPRVTATLRQDERVTPLELFFDLVFVLAIAILMQGGEYNDRHGKEAGDHLRCQEQRRREGLHRHAARGRAQARIGRGARGRRWG
jgi:hypothetical protein